MIPIHNEAATLEICIDRMVEHLSNSVHFKTHEWGIVLAENGSSDRSIEICKQLATRYGPQKIKTLQLPKAGMGYALYDGTLSALKDAEPDRETEHWVLMTAADLPFQFTDLEAFFKWMNSGNELSSFAIGSKAHADSRVAYSVKRRLMSFIFRVLRGLILGMKTADSQGSLFLRQDVVQLLFPKIKSRDFFFSTELTFLAEQLGIKVKELPIVYEGDIRQSSVKPVRDGYRMFKQLLQLRLRSAKD